MLPRSALAEAAPASVPAVRRLRLATWNINSLRLRLPLLRELIAALDPDVICLQETKVPDELFPHDALAPYGYAHVAHRGMKGYNGVAVLSRVPLVAADDTPDWCLKNDRRHLLVRLDVAPGSAGEAIDLHVFYVPAGGDVPDRTINAKFGHKLDFVAQAGAWFAARPGLRRTVLVGDLNIAPLEQDVWSHRQLLKVVSHTPPEVAALNAWRDAGFVDAVRHFVPADEKLFTWWSYRNQDWRASDRGRRLDHIWVTPDLVPALRAASVLRDARDWPVGSDHVPVMIELAL